MISLTDLCIKNLCENKTEDQIRNLNIPIPVKERMLAAKTQSVYLNFYSPSLHPLHTEFCTFRPLASVKEVEKKVADLIMKKTGRDITFVGLLKHGTRMQRPNDILLSYIDPNEFGCVTISVASNPNNRCYSKDIVHVTDRFFSRA